MPPPAAPGPFRPSQGAAPWPPPAPEEAQLRRASGQQLPASAAHALHERPSDCPAPLWALILRCVGEECLRGLRPHSGVVAALSVELAAVGDGRLRAFLEHLDDIHRRAENTNELVAEARHREFQCRQELDAAVGRLHDCHRELSAVHAQKQEQVAATGYATSELDRARFQMETLTIALEQANRRLVDASAHWEHEVVAERHRAFALSISSKDENMAMQRALVSERRERALELQRLRDLSARLDASTDESLKKGRDIATVELQAAMAKREAESMVHQMEEWVRKTLGTWQRQREQEVGELRRQLELVKLGGIGGVTAEEADRAMLFVASLWHAAGRREPRAMSPEEEARCVEGALNSWRVYFHREAGSEVPLLRPTSSIVLSPLRMAAGARAAEVLASDSSAPPREPPWVTAAGASGSRFASAGGVPI